MDLDISIHAPREGSDGYPGTIKLIERISIHAPREGSDATGPVRPYGGTYFNPRSP